MEFLVSYKLVGSEIWRYLLAFFVLLAAFISNKVILYFFNKNYQVFKDNKDKKLMSLVLNAVPRPVTILLMAGGFYGVILSLNIPASLQKGLDMAIELVFTVGVAYLIYKLVDIIEFYLAKFTAKTESELDDMLVPLLRKTLRVIIIIILGLYIMESVSGKPVTTLIAGLGIGGLAVALAAQDTIKNLFGTFMVLADQPFKVGERILVGDIDGVVEELGFRSTKIRTLIGHLVTIPNDKLINSDVVNISKRPYIKRTANITITYDTPIEKVEKAIEIIREMLSKETCWPEDFPPRVYFSDFNDWSLNILVIYWFTPPAYWDFLEFNQKINLELMRAFEKEGIDFAFPSQTVYLANDDKRQLALKMLDKK